MSRFPEADLSALAVGSVGTRPTRVNVSEFARPLRPEAAREFLNALPDQLAGRVLREAVARTVHAHREGRPIVAMCGGHVVKVGVSPCLVALM